MLPEKLLKIYKCMKYQREITLLLFPWALKQKVDFNGFKFLLPISSFIWLILEG